MGFSLRTCTGRSASSPWFLADDDNIHIAGLCWVLPLETAARFMERTLKDVISLFQYFKLFSDKWLMLLTDLQAFKSHVWPAVSN